MVRSAILFLLFTVLASQLPAQRHTTYTDFEQYCANCHDRRDSKAPPFSSLVQLPTEVIYKALTTGKMQLQAASLSDSAKLRLAEFLGGRKLNVESVASAKTMSRPCPSAQPIGDISTLPAWNGWGVDVMNTRFQPFQAAQLSPDQVHNLKLKWAFGLPGTSNAKGLPSVVAGRVYNGTDTGAVYSIDAVSGCVYWSFQADASVRTAISVGPGDGKPLAYFGDQKGNTYAVDAATGSLVWKVNVESHPLARITGAPTLYHDRLYVTVASDEEDAGILEKYECCTFRGSVTALNAKTGEKIWKTYTVPEPLVPIRKNGKGIQLWGPAGAGVWSAPTIDPDGSTIYVATGNAYTEPATKGSDALEAIDLDSGKVRWIVQEEAGDAWITGCAAPMGHDYLAPKGPLPPDCPKHPGIDDDFGQSPIVKKLADGRSIVVVAQRIGMVFAHDPASGDLLWKRDLGSYTLWGGAADESKIYYGTRKGVTALKLATGEEAWVTPLTPAIKENPGFDGAVSAIPGFLFLGGEDGIVRALSTESGREVWQYNTVREFKTVNGVPAHGGSISVVGPTVVGGMVYVSSGYIGINQGKSGNVILAFSPQ